MVRKGGVFKHAHVIVYRACVVAYRVCERALSRMREPVRAHPPAPGIRSPVFNAPPSSLGLQTSKH